MGHVIINHLGAGKHILPFPHPPALGIQHIIKIVHTLNIHAHIYIYIIFVCECLCLRKFIPTINEKKNVCTSILVNLASWFEFSSIST